jgi:cytochrome P450 family 110
MSNKLPDGPKIPHWLQLVKWIINPIDFLEDCASRYGEIFTLRFFGDYETSVFISNPQAIQEVFTTDAKLFDAGSSGDIIRPLVGDNSMLLLDGDRHKRERKMLTPPFHGDKVKSYRKAMLKALVLLAKG